eukprot:9819516-Lingulodinium_polyedra.AAC.1
MRRAWRSVLQACWQGGGAERCKSVGGHQFSSIGVVWTKRQQSIDSVGRASTQRCSIMVVAVQRASAP